MQVKRPCHWLKHGLFAQWYFFQFSIQICARRKLNPGKVPTIALNSEVVMRIEGNTFIF